MYIIYLKLYQAPLKKSERVLRAVPTSPHPHIHASLYPDIPTSPHPHIPISVHHLHPYITTSLHHHIPTSLSCRTPSSRPRPSSSGVPCPSRCGAHVGWWPHGATGAGTDAFPSRFPAKLLLGLLIFTEITCCERRRVYGPLTNRKPRASAGCKSRTQRGELAAVWGSNCCFEAFLLYRCVTLSAQGSGLPQSRGCRSPAAMTFFHCYRSVLHTKGWRKARHPPPSPPIHSSAQK
uniref:Uncharacterized protein n=1 Tax=Pavo cristatus TaxID=9049 RepID=A0A8C9FQY6_PAVCR